MITDLNQIAFLFHSVKNKNVVQLVRYLEENGIGVFSPRLDDPDFTFSISNR